jgi:hypothetical protein
MTRTAVLLAVTLAAGAAAGCGSGRAEPPATAPLPHMAPKTPSPAAQGGQQSGPLRPVPPAP